MNGSLLDLNAEERFFEDHVAGSVYKFGFAKVEESEIIEFAQRYNPQPFHTDPVAARATQFGGVDQLR
jgi:acyl dehydratase